MDRDEILHVLRAFEEQGLDYVLIGAAAMAFHGIVRATEDLDFFIRATAENVERLKSAFRQVYSDDPNVDEISADDLLGEFPAVRYYPPSGDLYFDVMTRLGDAADFDTVESVVMEVEGIRVWVATAQALYRLKKDTVRPLVHPATIGGVFDRRCILPACASLPLHTASIYRSRSTGRKAPRRPRYYPPIVAGYTSSRA